MALTKKQVRETAASAINSASTYAAVYESARRAFSGISPVCVVLSGPTEKRWEAASVYTNRHRITATIYRLQTNGNEDAAEDDMDTLVMAAVNALKNNGFLEAGSDTSETVPIRNIDGKPYRVHRLTAYYDEEL